MLLLAFVCVFPWAVGAPFAYDKSMDCFHVYILSKKSFSFACNDSLHFYLSRTPLDLATLILVDDNLSGANNFCC